MKPSAILILTVAMVTMFVQVSGHGGNFLTEKKRYCGRQLVGSLLKACTIGVFTRTTDEVQKRESNAFNEGTEDMGEGMQVLMKLYQMGVPLSESASEESRDTRDLRGIKRNISLLPTHFLLDKCCKFGCSVMDMVDICM